MTNLLAVSASQTLLGSKEAQLDRSPGKTDANGRGVKLRLLVRLWRPYVGVRMVDYTAEIDRRITILSGK